MNDSIYDKNGHLIYGTIPTQFPEETILTSKVSKISERVLFSDFRKYKGLSLYIQFLFTKEKGSLFNVKVWMKLLVKKSTLWHTV